MKKVALVFVLAVLLPSLVLAWLALRSQHDLQFLFERQQSALYQRVTDALAQTISDRLAMQQREFAAQVESLATNINETTLAAQFDPQLRQHWALAEVGFCVTAAGNILSPASNARAEAQLFRLDNAGFLGNREPAQVYYNANLNGQNYSGANAANGYLANNRSQSAQTPSQQIANSSSLSQSRKVSPQNKLAQSLDLQQVDVKQFENNFSRVIPAEAEFHQLIGNQNDGMLARFLQNKLKLMFWHRLATKPDLIFGAQLDLAGVVNGLREFIQPDAALQNEICLVLIDDNARPVALSHTNFTANWKRPFVATEIGEALPHWEIAAYVLNPARFTQVARTTRITLGLFIDVLVLTIGIGGWLFVRSLNAELKLARQKTDFVSNVSHELKTPLTSIRMFSELLADGRVTDAAKQKSYLNIITAEAARLTRLINNVLDFSRMESGEKKYNFQSCDLTEVVRSTAETFRPHLEASGFRFDCTLPETKIPVRGDSDALSQIIVNLLSNAEKYSNGGKEIALQVATKESPLRHAEIKVLDRGLGIPRGSESKIFEKFYRAHDSLGSGIQGSGLGLTIARQIARAHGGDVTCESREGGGSCFTLRLPISTTDGHR